LRPERYEAGTPNTPGILGLAAGVRFLAEHADEVRAEEDLLATRLHEGVLGISGFSVLGPPPGEHRVPIVAVVHDAIEADRLAFALDRRWGVAARAGLHCAPWAHRTLGTAEHGALRFGLGYGNSADDVDTVLGALDELVKEFA
jgi:selenocysteine lyase/cysteine desulfurase